MKGDGKAIAGDSGFGNGMDEAKEQAGTSEKP
jgi:hypothetical protein